MVKEYLTGSMIDAGAELIKQLDESGLSVTTALWFLVPEVNEWRLLFASPEMDAKGPREVYKKIQHAINQLGEKASAVPLSAVGLLDANADLVRRLKVAIPTSAGENRIRFSKNVIDGHFVDDALIYRAA
jgi:hypothetical protein